MRIFVASDLHIGQSQDDDASVKALAILIERNATMNDVLLLGGDYGNTDEATNRCLSLFRRFPGKVLAVPGNHDVWVESGDDSASRLERLRLELLRLGMHSLHHEPICIGGIAFVGSIGWYDYSFRDDINIPIASYEAKFYEKAYWSDAAYVDWRTDDVAITDKFLKSLEKQLRFVKLSNPSEIIGLIHHVPVKALLLHPRFLLPKAWRFLNAFLGSVRFGKLFDSYGVNHVFCGHIHSSKAIRENQTAFHSVGSDDGRRQLLIYEPGGGSIHHLWITS
jgi:putative phosphoesterase